MIDAEAEGARGEAAVRRVLAWKSGTFENLPAEPNRERTITKPVNALLLDAAQTMDETANPVETELIEQTDHRKTVWKLALLMREGAEFVVSIPPRRAKLKRGARNLKPPNRMPAGRGAPLKWPST